MPVCKVGFERRMVKSIARSHRRKIRASAQGEPRCANPLSSGRLAVKDRKGNWLFCKVNQITGDISAFKTTVPYGDDSIDVVIDAAITPGFGQYKLVTDKEGNIRIAGSVMVKDMLNSADIISDKIKDIKDHDVRTGYYNRLIELLAAHAHRESSPNFRTAQEIANGIYDLGVEVDKCLSTNKNLP